MITLRTDRAMRQRQGASQVSTILTAPAMPSRLADLRPTSRLATIARGTRTEIVDVMELVLVHSRISSPISELAIHVRTCPTTLVG